MANLRCTDCDTPLARAGRGAPPTRCPTCRAGRTRETNRLRHEAHRQALTATSSTSRTVTFRLARRLTDLQGLLREARAELRAGNRAAALRLLDQADTPVHPPPGP